MLHRKPFRVTQQPPPGAGSRGNVSDNADIPDKITALIKAASDKQHNNRTTEQQRMEGELGIDTSAVLLFLSKQFALSLRRVTCGAVCMSVAVVHDILP